MVEKVFILIILTICMSSRTFVSAVARSLARIPQQLPDKLKRPALPFEESVGVLRPEDRLESTVLTDSKYKGLVALGIGKKFSDRTEISKEGVDRFLLLHEMDKDSLKRKMHYGIIPLSKKGFSWEDYKSRSLRREYKEGADNLLEMASLCGEYGQFSTPEVIELVDVPFKTLDYLEGSSAAAIVDKKPHKRKDQSSGDAVYFSNFYADGKRVIVFGVFDGLTNKEGTDSLSALKLMAVFKQYFGNNRFFESDTILSLFQSFFQSARYTLVKSLGSSSGVSFSIGLVIDGLLYYLNVGDSRIYGISSSNSKVKKLTVDDGISGLVDYGAKINYEEFLGELGTPKYYAGADGESGLDKPVSFSSPNIGKIALSEFDMLLVATDGFWSNLPIQVDSRGFVLDASGEKVMQGLLSLADKRNTKQVVERLYNYARINMKTTRLRRTNYSVQVPNLQDIALLGFSV